MCRNDGMCGFWPGTGNRNGEQLAHILDGKLRQLNADYATFRQQARISEPRVILLPPDRIYDWSRDARNKLGGQSKIPHIDPTPDCFLTASLMAFCQDQPL